MIYFLRQLPWLLRNHRKYPGLLRAAFVAATTGNPPTIA